MVDPGLLGELPLGHLLRLELSSEPFIEGSTGLVDHRVVPGAPFGFPAPLRDTTTIGPAVLPRDREGERPEDYYRQDRGRPIDHRDRQGLRLRDPVDEGQEPDDGT